MFNKRNENTNCIYNRKILRNMLKKQIGSNKIQRSWNYLQTTDWGKKQDDQKIKDIKKCKSTE
jgi:hypothetical protein